MKSNNPLLAGKPFRKSPEGHPMVEGDSIVDYPHGPKAMQGLQDSANRPSPGHPAPEGGAPAQMPGTPKVGAGRNASKPTMFSGGM